MAKLSDDGRFLVASAEEARAILAKLKEDLAQNPELATRYQLSPGEVLGERGLSIPIQLLLKKERDLAAVCAPPSCLCTLCAEGGSRGLATGTGQ
jgi:hypothetical protein